MEVDERPTEQYSDIGGLDKQIQEVNTHKLVHLVSDSNVYIDCVSVMMLIIFVVKLLIFPFS